MGRQCARETSCLGAPGFKYYLRQVSRNASQEWLQWCELCQLFYTAASAPRRLNGFVQNWNPALELSQTCRLLKTREVSVSHSSWRKADRSHGLPGPGQGCCWLGIETKTRAKSQTENYLVMCFF